MFYLWESLKQRFAEITLFYSLKKLWDVMEIMKEYVTLTEYLNALGKNICIILDTCFRAVE